MSRTGSATWSAYASACWLVGSCGRLGSLGFAELVHHVDHSVHIPGQPERDRDEILMPLRRGLDHAGKLSGKCPDSNPCRVSSPGSGRLITIRRDATHAGPGQEREADSEHEHVCS